MVLVGVAMGQLATGCKAADRLSEREVVVYFQPGTTEQQNQDVYDRCASVPHSSPEPLPGSLRRSSVRLTEARFVVQPASDANLKLLYDCLQQFSYVRGVSQPGM
jgi:hypothetical protein